MSSCRATQSKGRRNFQSVGHVARAIPGMSGIPGVPSISVKEMYI